MATTSRSKANKSPATDDIFTAFPAALMANLPSTPMNGYATWWQAYMTGAAEMNKEFMNFITTRLQSDAELGQSLATCSDWADAASVHGDWVRKMSEEYTAETETLMEIASATAQESWAAANGELSDTDENQASKPTKD